ncbi:MAG: PepSY domain-containing protein [Gammaproteobacteria bacterium]|nr:PepSY domain-containing protein [Gammaproteobacteria bacterium]
MKLGSLLIGLIVIVMASFSAYSDDDNDRARALHERGKIVSLETLLQSIRQHGDWQILEIELEPEDDRLIYEVELLDQQGHVHKLMFDAKTGQELKLIDD